MSDNFSGDSFTEISSKSWLQRLGESILGVLFGFILIVVGVVLLSWNESRAVDAIRGLKQGGAEAIEAAADRVDPAQEGRLLHVSGALAVAQPARDGVLEFTAPGLVRLRRTVEMYQWRETTSTRKRTELGGREVTETVYDYKRDWSEEQFDSAKFHVRDGHANPPMPLHSAVLDSKEAKLGARVLTQPVLDSLTNFTAITPPETAPHEFRRDGDALYRGRDSMNPALGDMRVRLAGIMAQPISVLAVQQGAALGTYHASNGYSIALAVPGTLTAAEMLRQKAQEEQVITWILRAVGFVVVLISLLLIGGPISTLASVIPLLGDIIGGGVFLLAFGLAVPITLVTIAIAWIAVRPLIGGGILLGAVASFVLLRKLRPARTQQGPGMVSYNK